MPDLFTNLGDRGRRFVDRNNDGTRSADEWLRAGSRVAMLGPVGAGASILIPALSDSIRETEWGNRAGNWMERQARRLGWGQDSFVGPPEEGRPERTRRNRADPIFSDSSESDEAPRRSRPQRAARAANGPTNWVPGATARYSPVGPQAAHDRQHLVGGGYGTGGLLGLGNRQVLGQSSLNMRNPTVSNQVR